MKWIKSNGEGANKGELIECEIKHYNRNLHLPNKIIRGRFKDDGFYFADGNQLNWNWNIIRWRRLNKRG
jgi:hypothetical protein